MLSQADTPVFKIAWSFRSVFAPIKHVRRASFRLLG